MPARHLRHTALHTVKHTQYNTAAHRDRAVERDTFCRSFLCSSRLSNLVQFTSSIILSIRAPHFVCTHLHHTMFGSSTSSSNTRTYCVSTLLTTKDTKRAHQFLLSNATNHQKFSSFLQKIENIEQNLDTATFSSRDKNKAIYTYLYFFVRDVGYPSFTAKTKFVKQKNSVIVELYGEKTKSGELKFKLGQSRIPAKHKVRKACKGGSG